MKVPTKEILEEYVRKRIEEGSAQYLPEAALEEMMHYFWLKEHEGHLMKCI